MLIKMNDDDEADPGPMPQLEDMNPYLSALRAQLEAADKEALQDEPFVGDGVPPDDRKPWYWRFAKQTNEAALPDESSDVPPQFQLCRELSEVCESVETSSSVEAMEIEAMDTPPRAATPERSLPVTFCLSDAEAEFQFDAPSPDNAKILSLLKEKQEMEIEASQRGL